MSVNPEPAGFRVEVPSGKGVYAGDHGTQVNIFGPQVQWPVYVGRAPLLADAFQERRELRQAVEEVRSATGPRTALVLAGDGGTGKTQLAAAVFDRVRAGADLAVWVPATSRAAVLDTYSQAYAAIHPGAGRGEGDRDALAFLAWLGATTRPWVIVLDDVADPGELTRLWPAGPAGRIVITTRRRDASVAAHGRVMEVGAFSPRESLDYLTAKLGRAGGLPGVADEATELAADLGHLPLALAQAAAVIVNDAITCADYRALLAGRTRSLETLFPADPAASGDEYDRPVAGAWSLAAERADRLDPAGLARPMLTMAAVLDPNGVPEAVLTGDAARGYLARQPRGEGAAAPVEVADARRALRNLHRLSLVAHDPGDALRSIRIHALTQRWAVEAADPAVLADAVRTAADAIADSWPDVTGPPGVGQVLRANVAALAASDRGTLWEGAVHPAIFQAGRSLGEEGQAAGAVAYFQQVTDLCGRLLGTDHRDTLTARHDLAWWQGESGDFARAAASMTEVLADRVRILGAGHPDTLRLRHDLAYWQGHAGDPGGAAAATEAVIGDLARALGPDNAATLSARHNLADWRGRAGDPAGAAAGFAELLTDSLRVHGPDHYDTLDTRRNLAHWGGQAGDAAGAAAALEDVVRDYTRVLGPEHPDTMHARGNLAHWRGHSGNPSGAAAAYESLLADQLRVLGPDHPHTLTTRHDLAEWLIMAGDVAAAAAAFEALLADQTRVLGADHPHTMSTRHDFGACIGDARGADAAVAFLEPLVADRERVLGSPHPDTLASRHNLAYWQGVAGDPAGAAAALRQLLEDQVPVLGADHHDTFAVRHNLAYWQARAGDLDEAVAAFGELIHDEMPVFGPDHPELLEARQELAELRGQSGDVPGAIADFRQLLTDEHQVLQPDHPLIATTRGYLARWEGEASPPPKAP